jgi:CheY-like chemotaxis protein
MKKILLVDDNDSFRRPLSQTLEQSGYEVESATDGAMAVRLFRQKLFDLVITDLIMPEKDGLEVIAELRRLQPELKVIAISGGGWVHPRDYLPMARFLGASETLAKPFTAAEILRLVANVLGEAQCAASSH